MVAILFVTGGLTLLSIALIRCGGDPKPGKARTHWNAPPRAERMATLDELVGQANVRAAPLLPGASIYRIVARQVDAQARVHVDYGSLSVEYVAPGQEPCSVHLVLSWQGWAQRPGGACHDAPPPPRCPFAQIVAEAFADKPAGALAIVEFAPPGAWSVRFKDLPGAPVFERADDCQAGSRR